MDVVEVFKSSDDDGGLFGWCRGGGEGSRVGVISTLWSGSEPAEQAADLIFNKRLHD